MRALASNIKTIAILASEDYLPQLRACINSLKKNFSADIDINVAWFGDSLPILPKNVLIHRANQSTWANQEGTTLERILSSRPSFFRFLLKEMHYHQVLHIGSDVMFYSISDWIFDAYKDDDTAACPHSCAPYPDDTKAPHDLQIHLTGQLNSDFVLYNGYKSTIDFLNFQIREHKRCFGNNTAKGHFYDQVWLSFLPYYTNCKIIKDPRINVAYYNLHDRKLIRTAPGQYWVQIPEVPSILYQLTCFQFTGYNPNLPAQLSKFNTRLEYCTSDIVSLCLEYHKQLEDAGWQP